MAGELIWSRAALDDLEAIAAFVARDSAIQARRLVEQVFQGAERLLVRPRLDQPRALGQRDETRDYSVQGLRVLYERQGDDVHLLGIMIGAHATEAKSMLAP
ncbi:type II toxin-antitoxin system RelE/ParE family toxin [Thermochromatium tepidum]|uniref:Type II toxin-antitoxin system RelE/ParE family toxin n=1 Tax=Thermochromatium tepidum ATCC 43061 TaxID=316276 RepID=A0A6I6E3S1_THETI|nr:type II toxin-antitoxin system RelE/ParE family toxin [Thermochromatium tepidum]QGU32428.1 type II toxin-antitoxin system RelE/ParE family toxin [Thermochromatium tepidum ATCC 43061]QGU33595.1 type II toxin-antitoxin system RelE/ParE family toxin [Thermochromatium tepidum ATCC 43061]